MFLFWSLRLHHASGGADSENGLCDQHSQLANPAKGSSLGGGNVDPGSLTALAILVTPEALYDPDSPRVGLGLVYKAPYIQATSFSEAYFSLKLAS